MRSALFAALIVATLQACAPPTPQAPTVAVRVSPTPATVGNARIMLDIQDSIGSVVTGATVQLEGRPLEAEATVTQREAAEEAPGRYVVNDFRFPNPGVWTLDVTVTSSDGVVDRVQREVRVVGGRPP